ncbi:MAG: acylphosphatase [Nitrososphaerales archaeon]
MSTKRVRLTISGKVQGVFFRASLRDQARELGVSGWVRNTSDGNVEALIEGEPRELDRIINWSRIGPPGAVVDKVREQEESIGLDMSSFDIID